MAGTSVADDPLGSPHRTSGIIADDVEYLNSARPTAFLIAAVRCRLGQREAELAHQSRGSILRRVAENDKMLLGRTTLPCPAAPAAQGKMDP
jgi:hypothetical protein